MRRWLVACLWTGIIVGFGGARADTLVRYAVPDDASPDEAFDWHGSPVGGGKPLREILVDLELATPPSADGVEIRLLARRERSETAYRSRGGSGPAVWIRDWQGSIRGRLVLRGQVDRTGGEARAITTLVGPSLETTLCGAPGGCPPRPDGPGTPAASVAAPGPDNLDRIMLAGLADPAGPVPFTIGDQTKRINCARIDGSTRVELVEMGFRDCWLPAVAVFGSRNVALRDAVVQGSSYAFAAFPAPGAVDPATAHSFEVTGTRWEPSPASYRTPVPGCDQRRDWDCPVSIWADLPWGVTHSFFWEPLNGALFGSRDILGNVRVAGNVVVDAFNGVRAKVGDACLADPACLARTNVGFEIVGNRFTKVRDNPVEPEGHAVQWIVKHNEFMNVHGAISTDGVAGRDFHVFGNTLDFDELPGTRCAPAGWPESRKFVVAKEGGSWGPSVREAAAADPSLADKAECGSHRRGVFVKMGWQDGEPSPGRLLERIHVFHNTLRVRGPILARKPASPVSSWNNSVTFAGCGPTGDPLCRQDPDADSSCAPHRHWTRDRQALHSDCLPLAAGDGHDFRNNAFDRALDATVSAFERDHVVLSAAHGPVAPTGCGIEHRPPVGLVCEGKGEPVGARLPDGRPYDRSLPFGFPFQAALRLAEP